MSTKPGANCVTVRSQAEGKGHFVTDHNTSMVMYIKDLKKPQAWSCYMDG